MIHSFYVKNFRLFDELKVPSLSQVNLIVGKNNSGKTALLEAIFTYFTNSNPSPLFDLLIKRQEDWSLENDELVAADVLKHLFLDHHLPNVGEEGIVLGQLTAKGNVSKKNCVEIKTFMEVREEEDERVSVSYSNNEDAFNVDGNLVLLRIVDGKDILQKTRLQEDFRSSRLGLRRMFAQKSVKNSRKVQFVTTEFADNHKVSALWDAINLTDLDVEVIEGLKIIDPRIEGVAFVESERSRGRIPLIKLKGTDERLSLKSLGDGVFRIFYIILSLVNAKGGYLFIDEFENGLHWSVQKQIWNVIFTLSSRLDIQVFATTHSHDCIRSFESIWKKKPDKAAFYRLSGSESKHSVTSYDLDTLSDSMEMDVEVR